MDPYTGVARFFTFLLACTMGLVLLFCGAALLLSHPRCGHSVYEGKPLCERHHDTRD